jgi:hypothetical protein
MRYKISSPMQPDPVLVSGPQIVLGHGPVFGEGVRLALRSAQLERRNVMRFLAFYKEFLGVLGPEDFGCVTFLSPDPKSSFAIWETTSRLDNRECNFVRGGRGEVTNLVKFSKKLGERYGAM